MRPRRGNSRRLPGAAVVIAVLFTACATTSPPVQYKGADGPVSWVVDNATVQFYPNNRLKWLYRLRLRETAGVGVVLHHVSRVQKGYGVNTATAEARDQRRAGAARGARIDVRRPPLPDATR